MWQLKIEPFYDNKFEVPCLCVGKYDIQQNMTPEMINDSTSHLNVARLSKQHYTRHDKCHKKMKQ